MLIYCFNGPTVTSMRKTWQTISLYQLTCKYHYLIHLLLKHPKYFRIAVLKSILKFASLVKYKPKYFTLELQPRVSLFSCKVALGALPPKVTRWLLTGLNKIPHVPKNFNLASRVNKHQQYPQCLTVYRFTAKCCHFLLWHLTMKKIIKK